MSIVEDQFGISLVQRGKALKIFVSIFLTANMFFSVAYGDSDLQIARPREVGLVVGYSSKVFFDVDIKDAQVATKLWTDKLVQNMGALFERSEVVVFDNLLTLENLVKQKSVDIVVLFSQEFIEIKNKCPPMPIFSADYGKLFYHQLLVISRGDSGIDRFSDLKQKRAVIELGQKGSLPTMWLESLLAKEKFSDPKAYFSSFKEAVRASQVVLPVFFRQADGCIVGRNGFEMMSELNPQVGKELKTMIQSPMFLTGVVCMRKDFYEKYGGQVSEALQTLYAEPHGRQILMLFRINRLVRFKEEHLESVELFVKEHRDLTVRVAQRR